MSSPSGIDDARTVIGNFRARARDRLGGAYQLVLSCGPV
jgi:hypothetical protein